LEPRLRTTGRGGLAVGATCLNYQEPAEGGPNGGRITIDDLPAGATVLHAWLYWSVLHSGPSIPMGTPAFEGSSLRHELLGVVPLAPCFGLSHTGTYRADVTNLVAGNGSYAIAGFPGRGNALAPLAEGATLFVIWCHPSAPLTDIVLLDGAETLTQAEEPIFSQTITGFSADPGGPVTATLAMAAGNGQIAFPPMGDGEDLLVFNGVDLDALHPEILSGAACPRGFYDRTVVDVSDFVGAGDTSAERALTVTDDCYTLAALALAVSADPAGAADSCEGAGCGGAVDVPPSPASCDSAAVDVELTAFLRGCPSTAGAVEVATQLVDPLTALDASVQGDLGPAFAIEAAASATLELTLDGRTDLDACTLVELIDPGGFRHRIKPFDAPLVSPLDARPWYTGPGTYSLHLLEAGDCGSATNGDASITDARLTVQAFPTSTEGVEHRVEDSSGGVPCDWSTDASCRLSPSSCPGREIFIARVRCLDDPGCESSRAFELCCSALSADFQADVPCGSSRACFTSDLAGGLGLTTLSWDFAGEGSADEPAPCHDFAGPPPWTVVLRAVDESGCESRIEREVAPEPAAALPEPSAGDLDPRVEPLRVRREGGLLRVDWEDLGPDQTHHLYRGRLGSWYSHEAFGWCDLELPAASPAVEPGNAYFVAVGVACDGSRSSMGRNHAGLERPGPADSCP
jgi:hypothetical protein